MSRPGYCWKCENLRNRIEGVAHSVGVRPAQLIEDLQELGGLRKLLSPSHPMSSFPKTRKALEQVIRDEEKRLLDVNARVISALIEKLPYILWDWAMEPGVEE